MSTLLTIAPVVQDGQIRFDHIIGGFFLLVILGGIYGLLWIRRHPDAD